MFQKTELSLNISSVTNNYNCTIRHELTNYATSAFQKVIAI